jgi:hypothetical protein
MFKEERRGYPFYGQVSGKITSQEGVAEEYQSHDHQGPTHGTSGYLEDEENG